jgi:hypothetical protein
MKKFTIALTIFALFISSSVSSITPSIIINGILPEKDDIFLIQYGSTSSELDLDSGYLNISEDTNFIDNTETGSFNILVGNFTAEDEIHTLKFSTDGFKKIQNSTIPTDNNFTFEDSVTALDNDIYISFTNEDSSKLGMSLLSNNTYSIKNNVVQNSLTVNSAASFTESTSPGYTFKFSWQNETDTGKKVPAGDYVTQVTVEYINGN